MLNKHIRLLSCLELRRLLSRSGLQEWLIAPQRIAEIEQQTLSGMGRAPIMIYHVLLKLPGLSFVFKIFGPLLQVVGRK